MNDWNILFGLLAGVALGGLFTWIIGKYQSRKLLRNLKNALMDKSHVSLNEEFLMTQMLGEKIKKAGFKPDVIFSICPGGSMIAEWLSRRVFGDFRDSILVKNIYISSSRSNTGVITEKAEVKEDIDNLTAGLSNQSKVLLVNDISRGGGTLEVANEFLKGFFSEENIKAATLICHQDARTKPHFQVINTDKTVRFDWKEAPQD